ncbi:MAG: DUF4013 domain-containing protein [Chloroflexi bacterium]|nr:DUF4013 domain-containing protein [Chloroflexota bacterium]
MDIGRAYTYMFDDEDWLKKLAIGGLVMLIPILNFVALGYAIRALRNARDGQALPLPEWDDWGDDFVRGLLITIATFIYSLPAIIAILLGVVFAGVFDEQACMWAGYCPGILWSILVAFITPALFLQYAKHDSFGSLFRFGEIWRIVTDQFSTYLVAVLMVAVAFIVAGVIGSVACGIGAAWTSFWAYLVQSHLMAQLQPGTPAVETGAGI